MKCCPICGGEVRIILCDDEGNHRPDSYADNPWSGLGYLLYHSEEEYPDCPIAHEADSQFGRRIYDTPEQAQRVWERRVEQSCCPFCGASFEHVGVQTKKGKRTYTDGEFAYPYTASARCKVCHGRGPVVSLLITDKERVTINRDTFRDKMSTLTGEALRLWKGRA